MTEHDRVMCTLGLGPHAALVDLHAPILRAYAVRHGYDLVVRHATVGLRGRPASWGKVLLVHELLQRYDTVVWLDADTVIVDPRDDIAAGVRARRLHVVHHVVDGVSVPNMGVMVLRRSPGTMELLTRLWHRTEFTHHRWWENAALIAELGGDADVGLVSGESQRRARRTIGSLPLRWNSIPPCPAPSPAIVHLAGLADAERLERMRSLVGRSSPGAQPRSQMVHGGLRRGP